MPARSRLSKAQESKSRKQLFLSIAGIIVILFLLVKFGIPMLINFSLFLAGIKNGNSTSQDNNSSTIILPPVLNPTFTATNSAKISVSGTSVAHQSIQLFLNDDLVDSVDTKNDGTFTFDNVVLNQGQNILKAKAKTDNKLSEFSVPLNITYGNKAPTLTIDSPQNGQTFSKDNRTVNVSGKTDPDVRVTVNDFWAIVDNNGNYSYSLQLQNGDNTIKVLASTPSGNKSEQDIHVTYNP